MKRIVLFLLAIVFSNMQAMDYTVELGVNSEELPHLGQGDEITLVDSSGLTECTFEIVYHDAVYITIAFKGEAATKLLIVGIFLKDEQGKWDRGKLRIGVKRSETSFDSGFNSSYAFSLPKQRGIIQRNQIVYVKEIQEYFAKAHELLVHSRLIPEKRGKMPSIKSIPGTNGKGALVMPPVLVWDLKIMKSNIEAPKRASDFAYMNPESCLLERYPLVEEVIQPVINIGEMEVLPEELIYLILGFLKNNKQLVLRHVCRDWNNSLLNRKKHWRFNLRSIKRSNRSGSFESNDFYSFCEFIESLVERNPNRIFTISFMLCDRRFPHRKFVRLAKSTSRARKFNLTVRCSPRCISSPTVKEAAPYLENLRKAIIPYNVFLELNPQTLQTLHTLHLDCDRDSLDDRIIDKVPDLTNLQDLSFHCGSHAKLIEMAPYLKQLQALTVSLSSTSLPLRAEMIAAISDNLSDLKALRIKSWGQDGEEIIPIFEQCRGLRFLYLAGMGGFTDNTLYAIAENLPDLEVLTLGAREITDRGLRYLVERLGSKLKVLKIAYGDKLTDDSLGVIALHCSRLKRLRIDCVDGFTNSGVDVVLTGLPELRFFFIDHRRTRVTEEHIDLLRQKYPLVTIRKW